MPLRVRDRRCRCRRRSGTRRRSSSRSTAPTAVGVNRSFTLHVPGPVKPPPVPHVSKSKANGAFEPRARRDLGAVARVDRDRHGLGRRRVDRHVAERDRGSGSPSGGSRRCRSRDTGSRGRCRPTIGHSKTFVVPLDAADRRRREPLLHVARARPGEAAAGAARVEVERERRDSARCPTRPRSGSRRRRVIVTVRDRRRVDRHVAEARPRRRRRRHDSRRCPSPCTGSRCRYRRRSGTRRRSSCRSTPPGRGRREPLLHVARPGPREAATRAARVEVERERRIEPLPDATSVR